MKNFLAITILSCVGIIYLAGITFFVLLVYEHLVSKV